VLVGPDNGLLTLAAENCGGIVEAVDIAASPLRLEPVAATFHGRDIFAPVAAHIAAGTAVAEAGGPLDPELLVGLELPRAHRESDGSLLVHALYIDRFGNIALDIGHDEMSGAGLKLGQQVIIDTNGGFSEVARYARTFADVPPGELLLYEDAYRRLAVAVGHGNAAAELGLGIDDELRIRPA
jgi:S-adenosylmethionine hydrolase